MDQYSSPLIGLILCIVALSFNFCFVILEISIIASSKAKLSTYNKFAHRRVQYILGLLSSPEEFLSTIQVGITLANIFLGLLSTEYLEEPLMYFFDSIAFFQVLLGDNMLLASKIGAIIIVTFVIVLFEILPKRIGILFPEKIAVFGVYFMMVFIWIFYPLVWLLTVSVKFLIKIMGIRNTKPSMSIEEVKFIIHQTEKAGTIDKAESDMMRRLVNIGHMQVGAIMTPRNKIAALDMARPIEENLQRLRKHIYSCYPLINGDYSKLIGVINTKNLVGLKEITNDTLLLYAKKTPIHYIPQMADVSSLLHVFKKKGIKFGVVVDEYGAFEGVATFTDIIKTFGGDVAILLKKQSPDIVELSSHSYIVSGNILIEEVMELMNVVSLPGYEENEYRTLASFALTYLANVPKIGDEFSADGWKFRVAAMDGMRIDRISMHKTEDNPHNKHEE